MHLDQFVGMLDRVRCSGHERYMAKCPAHEDRTASLLITGKPDGKITIHDFGGCSTASVVAALGLRMADLMPDRVQYRNAPPRPAQKPRRRHYETRDGYDYLTLNPLDLLRCTAAAWGLETECNAIERMAREDREYEKYGPAWFQAERRRYGKDRAPAWAAELLARERAAGQNS